MRIVAAAALLFALLPAAEALAQKQPPQSSPAAAPAARKPSVADAAAQGDGTAQFQMGLAHLSGRGAPRNAGLAMMWFRLAAWNGVPQAALELARAYEKGAGIRADLPEAARWWYRAGQLGDETARAHFLDLFLAGRIDFLGGEEGATWLETRADGDDVKAQLALAGAYEAGRGVAASPVKAEQWYLRAAFSNLTEAAFRLGRMELARPGLWEIRTKDEVRTYTLRPDPEEVGVAVDKIGFIRPGMVQGERWLRLAAGRGHVEAQYLLGMTYVAGLDLPLDMVDGVTWLSAAAAHGHAGARMAVAELAAKGQGFAGKDPVRAWVNYDVAAALGRNDGAEARDRLARTMNQRQLSRAHQVAEETRDLRGN
ncbi:MAG: sel1 repeat family protein [Magnetospirillum sp.]|nr:sel1 repeat family protein [Magnetospirillum sp.]